MDICLGKYLETRSDYFKQSRHFNDLKNIHIYVGKYTEEEKYALRMRNIQIYEYN
jgi:hypothetical protein